MADLERHLKFLLNYSTIHHAISPTNVHDEIMTIAVSSFICIGYYGGPERTWCKYILFRNSDLASGYIDLLSRYSDLTKSP